MASPSLRQLFLFSATLLFLSVTPFVAAKTSFKPKALVLPITKDPSTLQYTTVINQRTPLVPVKVVVDLGGKVLWMDCTKGYKSSSRLVTRCGSPQCKIGHDPVCRSRKCFTNSHNPFVFGTTFSSVVQDVLSIKSTNGTNPSRNVTMRRFVFSCTDDFLGGLTKGAVGIAGLGRAKTALNSQFTAAFNLQKKITMCLTSAFKGVIFLGDVPSTIYNHVPKFLTYTPLIIKRKVVVDFGMGPPAEYFIGLKKIIIGQNTVVSFNTSLLSFDKDGNGGTEISTVRPYTVLHSSIFKPFTEAYMKEASSMGLIRVPSVATFEVCFNSRNIVTNIVGPSVPSIDIVLQNESVVWKIFGANLMVKVNDKAWCLAFVDGGSSPISSIILGGYQLENYFLEFDLAKSRLGFSPTLLSRQMTCSTTMFDTKP